MNLRERFGCFFLIVGLAFFLLFAILIAQAFQRNPNTVPMDWIAIALGAAAVVWFGWRLHSAGRRGAVSKKPPSLGSRLFSLWKGKEDDSADKNEDGR